MDSKSFDNADETRTPPKAKVEVVTIGDVKAARMTLEPGWRWSECIKPIVGTDSCQLRHVGYASAGTMHVTQDDGSENEIRAGEAYLINPGHDAWIVGDETFVGFEFESTTAEAFAVAQDE
ncbi:MAG: hypothetical protein QOH89_1894 [Pseudonocardiales bacterium]|nr:hypothetical protein [Pseudonocardiales bacterium]